MTPSQPAAPSPLERALDALNIAEPMTWNGLTVFPLLTGSGREPPCDSFGAAHAAGTFRITEVSASGSVNQLRAINDGARPVLLLDGEEIVGAKQNRVFNLTIIVPAHTSLDIPVSCVEAGRWAMQSQAFRESGRAMFARSRADKARRVTESLRHRGYADADQGMVWRDVAANLQRLGVRSPSSAMSDAFDRHHAPLDGYVTAFPPQERQVGAIFALQGDVVGLEFFDSPPSFRASAPKLIQSYAAELLGLQPQPRTPDRAAALALVEEVRRASTTAHAAQGLGTHLRFDAASLTGAALALDDEVVHFFAFRTLSNNAPVPPRSGPPTPAQQLIRDGVMQCEDAPIFGLAPPPLALDADALRDCILGMLLGLAIGDGLGNTSEGMLPDARHLRHGEIRDYLPNRHAENRAVGLPSDDTQLAAWTLGRLLEDGELMPERVAQEFASRQIFGIGHTVRDAVRALHEGQPWYGAGQPSAGNGALMRIAPVLLPHLRDPSPRLWSDAAVAGMITHNDPGSIGSCVAFVELLWSLLNARSRPAEGRMLAAFTNTLRRVEGDVARYEPRAPHLPGRTTLAEFTRRHVSEALAHRAETQAALDHWYSGAFLLETMPSVLFILERHIQDPEQAIIRAVNDSKDNDTIAAIVGAAVGALHGLSGLPERWTRGLLGRTGADDDGELFRLVTQAADRFVGPARSRRDLRTPSLPLENSYAVPDADVIAGEYPFHQERAPGIARLRSLLDCGVTTFIDLTEPGESGLLPYAGELLEEATARGIHVDYHRVAIADASVPSASQARDILQKLAAARARGSRAYVHCWGGAGRTGVVVGCLLRERGMSGEQALQEVARLFSTMPKSTHRRHAAGSPQTDEQRAFVRTWTPGGGA